MSILETILNSRYQRMALLVSFLNAAIYVLTLSYDRFGSLGLHWTYLLNGSRIGDLLLVWFWLSAVFLVAYSLFIQIHAQSITWIGLACLGWSGLWAFELLWLHRFLVFR
jgi:hypothetical protein